MQLQGAYGEMRFAKMTISLLYQKAGDDQLNFLF